MIIFYYRNLRSQRGRTWSYKYLKIVRSAIIHLIFYKSEKNEYLWTVDEDLSLLNITSGTITLSIQSDNVLTLITTNNNRSLLGSITIKLGNETEAISLPITCVIAQSEDDQMWRSKQKPVDCPRHPNIKGCRRYSAIITVIFTDESQLEIAKNFTTYPGKLHRQMYSYIF